VTTIESFFGLRREPSGAALLELGRELHGAFGGAFGGLLAAALVLLSRDTAPHHAPSGLDCRFVRGLRAGSARVTSDVVHSGRTVTCVRLDVRDAEDRLTTTATVSLVDLAALHALDVVGAYSALETAGATWHAWRGPQGVDIPVVATLEPKLSVLGRHSIATSVHVPWDDDGAHTAEAACIAADFCVGPPVAAACEGAWLPHPNPDLSLRFVPLAQAVNDVVGIGSVLRIVDGLALVDIEVQAEGHVFAAGTATSMVLPGATP
jgi:acyl-coenzyme A thioesterase PaaI-like protein